MLNDQIAPQNPSQTTEAEQLHFPQIAVNLCFFMEAATDEEGEGMNCLGSQMTAIFYEAPDIEGEEPKMSPVHPRVVVALLHDFVKNSHIFQMDKVEEAGEFIARAHAQAESKKPHIQRIDELSPGEAEKLKKAAGRRVARG